jgi:hypothetical protein
MTDPYDPTSNNHAIGNGDRLSSPSLLDQDRLASMADEGGVSGALMDIDDTGERRRLIKKQRRPSGFGQWRTAAALFTLLGIAVVAWGWVKRAA